MKILIYMIIKLALCCWLVVYFFLGKQSPFNHVFKNFRKSIGLDTKAPTNRRNPLTLPLELGVFFIQFYDRSAL